MAAKRVMLVILALLLTVSSVFASDIFVKHEGDNIVEIGGRIKFSLSITNEGEKTRTLLLNPEPYSGLPSSPVDLFIVEPKMIEVPNGATVYAEVSLKMKDTVLPKENYATYVTVQDIENPSVEVQHDLVMNIVPPDELVSVSTSVPKTVSPSGEFKVDVNLKNNMNLQLSNVEVYVGSDLFEETRTMILFPMQRRTEEFKFQVPAAAKPQDYAFSIRVYQNGVLNGKFSDTFSVQEYSDMGESVSEEKAFLGRVITVRKFNRGNSAATARYSYPASWITGMFVSSSVDETSSDSDGLQWVFEVKPGEERVLQVTVSYVPLLIAAFVVLLFVAVAYYLLTRGLIVRKKVFKLRKSHDTAQFTVMLHIKNRTRGAVKDLTVFEILPKLVKISTSFSTLKPTNVQQGDQGEKLIWKIPALMKGEERIISYQADSKVSVLGCMNLPGCMIRYKNENGKVVNVKSNSVSLDLD